MKDSSDIAKSIKKLLIDRSMTQGQLEKRIGMCHATMSHKMNNPMDFSIGELMRIEKVLKGEIIQ